MKLFNAFKEPGFHTTITSSFGIDFQAYEQIVLARLRDAGCMNNIVVADSRMLTLALDEPERAPQLAGVRYSLVGADTPVLFHPKLTLQLGGDSARLLVASANLTTSGLAGNLEVVGELRMRAEDQSLAGVMQQALEFLEQFVHPAEHVARKQLEWARSRSPWLSEAESADASPLAQLLTSAGATGIGLRFLELVGQGPVQRLIVASPYWDSDLGATRFLQRALKPRKTALVVDTKRGLFPGTQGVRADLHDVSPLAHPRNRFAHAKVFIVQTKKADHVLFGSPNCTTAALGTSDRAGVNVEAALYKRMPPGAALGALELERALEVSPVDESEIADYERAEEIPLEEAAARQPGRFQLVGLQLSWSPSAVFDVAEAMVELLDAKQELLVLLSPTGGLGARTFTLELAVPPRFGRVHRVGHVSAVAVVHIDQALMDNLRPAKNKQIKDGLELLDGGDIEGLYLYEALDLIDAGESKLSRRAAAGGRVRGARNQGLETPLMTYDEFMRARERAGEQVRDLASSNSLASSHANEVRALLNALIGIDDGQLQIEEVDIGAGEMPLGMGDEIANGEAALEEGLEIDRPEAVPQPANAPAPLAVTRAADTEKAILNSVSKFTARIKKAAGERDLTTRDLLRIRLLLTVILASGSKKLVRRSNIAPGERPPVLVARGDVSWPRLAGRVLFTLSAAGVEGVSVIGQVKVPEVAGARVPVDILECFATCFWAVAALALARDERNAQTEIALRAHKRAEEIYGATILHADDLMSEPVKKVLDALGSRYAERLGVSQAAILHLHSQMSAAAETFREQAIDSAEEEVKELNSQ